MSSIDCHFASIYDTKTRKKIIKVDTKSKKLSFFFVQNINFSENYKQLSIG